MIKDQQIKLSFWGKKIPIFFGEKRQKVNSKDHLT